MESMKVFKWAIHTIVVPLSPLLVVGLIASQPEKAIPYERILGGTEIFLLCLFIAAATYRDWDDAKAKLADSSLWNCLSPLLLIWVQSLAIMSVFILIHTHVQDLGLRAQFVANAGIVFGLLTAAICLSAQVFLASAKQKREW